MKCGEVIVKVKLSGVGYVPKKGSEGASGYDLCSVSDYELHYNSPILVSTGLFLEIPSGYEGQVRSRSGLASKGVFVLNSPGTIDSDYRGEVKVLLVSLNDTLSDYQIKAGDRIAQLVFCKLPLITLCPTKDLGITKRQDGGFGSTGIGSIKDKVGSGECCMSCEHFNSDFDGEGVCFKRDAIVLDTSICDLYEEIKNVLNK